MMVTRKTIKLLKSLHQKKYRYQHRLFTVEGAKSVLELLASAFTVKTLLGTEVFLQQHKNLLAQQLTDDQVVKVDEATLSGLSYFKNNNAALALAALPSVSPAPLVSGYALALDNIRDPGNLGTIIRVADWYGIRQVICSEETTDAYAPKVISASMGSFLRVPVAYVDLSSYLSSVEVPVYGAVLDRGIDLHHQPIRGVGGVILLGNESAGIRPELESYIREHVHIPRYGGAESLNVGVAAAVICDNLMRNRFN